MHIFHMIGHLRFGAGRYIVDLAKEQARRGNRVTVLVSNDCDGAWVTDRALVEELLEGGCSLERAGDFFSRDLTALRKTAQTLHPSFAESDDLLVHAHSAMAAFTARLAGAEWVMASCHGWDRTRPDHDNLQDAMAWRLCDSIITASQWWADEMASFYAMEPPLVIPGSIAVDRFDRERAGGKHEGPLKIVTACELTHRKGIDLLLEAYGAINEAFPGVELHIYGHGDLADELRHAAARYGDALQFHGRVAEPWQHYGAYDLYCHPARSDNFPLSLMEAALCGLPIAASRVGGVPEIVEPAGCGELFEPDSVAALTATIIDMLGAGRETLRKRGADGRRYAQEKWSSSLLADRIESICAKQKRPLQR